MHSEIDKNKIENGLYIVSTPIGNLKDLTFRALETLKISDYIFCEDTRVAKKLLNYYNIKSRLISNHKFNEKKNIERYRKILISNNIISLISDAGPPLISDPGKIILNVCIKNNIKITPIPGVSAVTTALSISNFSDNFYFHGFFSEKKNELENELKFLSDLSCTIIFFVSPKKINKLIYPLKNYFHGRQIIFCRELTKYYEEIKRYNLSEIQTFSKYPKGEITVLISGNTNIKKRKDLINESVKIKIKKLIHKLSVKDITDIISDQTNISKSAIYKYCINIKNDK